MPFADQAQPPWSESASHIEPQTLLASLREAVYDWDIASDRLSWASDIAKILDIRTKAKLRAGKGYESLTDPASGAGRAAYILGAREIDAGAGIPYRLRYALRNAAGSLCWIEDTGRWYAGLDGRPASAHGLIRLVLPPQLPDTQSAQIDPLTGALRQDGFLKRLNAILEGGGSALEETACLVVSIGDLSRINRERGFEAGSEVLTAIGRRIRATMRRSDCLARIDGNRFAALLRPCNRSNLDAIAHRFQSAINGSAIDTSAGPVGPRTRVAALGLHGDWSDAHAILSALDDRLEQPERRSGARQVPLGDKPAATVTGHAANDILRAINERQLVLAYQPIADAASGEIAFHEALVRIRMPDGLVLGAGRIVPTAEQFGIIRFVDQRVLELAFAELAQNDAARLSINVAVPTLLDREWLTAFDAYTALHPARAARLIVEITETATMSEPDEVKAIVAHLKSQGSKVAIDDFGSGQTSFRLLRDLGADIVKIDGAFIQNLARSTDDRFFVRTLVDLAKHRDMKVVAEWVQDGEAASMLRDWGVDYLQGEYVGMAVGNLARPKGRQRKAG